jgi:hypothetical protein
MATLAKRSGLWSTRPIILIGSAGYGFSGPKNMNVLTIFGLCAVTAMLIFYAIEDCSPD